MRSSTRTAAPRRRRSSPSGRFRHLQEQDQRNQRRRHPPGQRDIEPDAGQIHVTVGHHVIGNLDQSQHRRQHAQIPEPADKDSKDTGAARSPRPRCGAAKSRSLQPLSTPADHPRNRVEGRQIDRIKKRTLSRRKKPPHCRSAPTRPTVAPLACVAASSGNRPPPAPPGAAFPTPAASTPGRSTARVQSGASIAEPNRASGQKSSSNNSGGSVTSIGLAIRPSANSTATSR